MPVDQIEDLEQQTEAPEVVQEPEESEKATIEQNEDGKSVRLPAPKSRKERRAERDPIRTRDAEIERLRRDLDETRGMMHQLRGHFTGQAQAPAAAAPQDPFRAEMTAIRREQESISAAIRAGHVTSETEVNRLKDRFYELEDKKHDLNADRAAQRALARMPQQVDPNEAILRAEFPEIWSDPAKIRAATGIYQHMRLTEGKPESISTARAALQQAAERLGLRSQPLPKPSPAQQARYGAIPAQAGAKGGGSEVRLSPAQERMARSMYPNLGEDEALIRWAREVGSKLNED